MSSSSDEEESIGPIFNPKEGKGDLQAQKAAQLKLLVDKNDKGEEEVKKVREDWIVVPPTRGVPGFDRKSRTFLSKTNYLEKKKEVPPQPKKESTVVDRGPSLLEQHKESMREKKSGGKRVPFDRDVEMKGRAVGSNKVAKLVKEAGSLHNRFA